jgi:GNAT superfamily N-acetyltransferase
MTLRHLTSHAELLDASGGDPFIRYDLPADFAGPGWAWGSAVVALRATHTHRLGLVALGAADDLGRLCGELVATGALDGLPVRHVTVQRGGLDAVAEHLPLGRGDEWEWMYAAAAPPVVPAESRLVALDGQHEPEIRALLALANQRTDARPFEHPGQDWVGAWDDVGRLVACGVREPSTAGYPILSGITTHPDHRGQGLGLAVTAYLTRAAVLETGVCTLGLYSDNDVARRVYHGLGYTGDHLWSSRRFVGEAEY